MVIRATSIDLNPYLEKVCMEDLPVLCGNVNTAVAGEVRNGNGAVCVCMCLYVFLLCIGVCVFTKESC